MKNDKYAVQRVVDVMRAENGQFYLLIEYLGYRYLEARPESWLEDKKGELRLAYKAHATVRLHKGMLYCGGGSPRGHAIRPVLEGVGTGEQAGAAGEVSVPDQPCVIGETGIVSGRGECIPDVSCAGEPAGFPLLASEPPMHWHGGWPEHPANGIELETAS